MRSRRKRTTAPTSLPRSRCLFYARKHFSPTNFFRRARSHSLLVWIWDTTRMGTWSLKRRNKMPCFNKITLQIRNQPFLSQVDWRLSETHKSHKPLWFKTSINWSTRNRWITSTMKMKTIPRTFRHHPRGRTVPQEQTLTRTNNQL